MSQSPLLHITFIGTSCLLLEFGETRILTDPWFSRRMRFLPALRTPGLSLGALPSPTLILCSHLHADHYDRRAIEGVSSPHTVLVGPVGLAGHRPRRFLGPVAEMAPNTRRMLGNVLLEAVPMRHTFPPPAEVGYRIELGPFSLFFAGDASYSGGFVAARRLGRTDIALLPVGGSLIWGTRTVMDASDAVRAARDLGATFVIPMHPGGEWPALPPMSRHPGRLKDLAQFPEAPFVPVILAPGRQAAFQATDDGVNWLSD
jgi:L-ascorbate metabolism protein UlaG (beta-lactamase superfamily)